MNYPRILLGALAVMLGIAALLAGCTFTYLVFSSIFHIRRRVDQIARRLMIE